MPKLHSNKASFFRQTTLLLGLLSMLLVLWSCKRNKKSKKVQAHHHAQGQGNHHEHSHGKKHAHKKGHAHSHHHGMRHDFSDVKRWVKIFDNPKRKAWQKPMEVIKLMAIKPGMTVVDIGAGTGYFLPYLRTAVGAKGKVLGLDLAATLVKHMNQRAKKAGWKNVTATQVKPNDPQLAPKSVDRILIVNTWHHVQNRGAYAAKLKAALKPGGAVFVVDFGANATRGPSKKHRLTPKQVSDDFTKGALEATILQETLPEQYIVKGQ